MRASAIGSLVWSSLIVLAPACGKSSDAPGSVAGAGQLSAGSDVGGSAAGESSGGGGNTSGGAGSTSGGAGAASTGGQGAGAGGQGAGAAGASSGLLECDPSKVQCERATPKCVFGEVPQVVGSCYGECVKVERCACSTAAQCPQPEQYTCWSQSHCGPFVN